MRRPTPLALTRLLQEKSLDALLVQSLPNLRYLCGFTGTDGVLVVLPGRIVFLTDSRYATQAQQQVTADEVIVYRQKWDSVCDLLRRSGVVRTGFEGDVVTVAQLQQLEEKGGGAIRWQALTTELRTLRMLKTAEEIAALERAAELNERAFAAILPWLRPGVRECEVALELEIALKRLGGEDKAFDFIVASGERGAMPHGVASDRKLCAGELVTVDFGTRWQGYHSDETVTLALGAVPDRLRELFDLTLEAHDRALDAICPGVTLQVIDGVARNLIEAGGYGENFGHGLGHGVGLEIHEAPVVSQRSEEVAREHMVFTVEPGIYVEGVGGVRIEDTVVVTANGCRRLTRIPKSFRMLPV